MIYLFIFPNYFQILIRCDLRLRESGCGPVQCCAVWCCAVLCCLQSFAATVTDRKAKLTEEDEKQLEHFNFYDERLVQEEISEALIKQYERWG